MSQMIGNDNEFTAGSSLLESPLERRTFLKLMGSSMALAGLTGCKFRKPSYSLIPYAKQPEYIIPGKSLFYATTMSIGEDVTGLLVETHEGRPTKIEGNPLHPNSLGSANTFHQASILDLYDPDRLQTISHQNKPQSKDDFETAIRNIRNTAQITKGNGVAVLLDVTTSPTIYRQLSALVKQFPKISLHRYTPIHSDSIHSALSDMTHQKITPFYNFSKANVVVSFDSDFLGSGPHHLRHAKAFSKRRTPDGKQEMNRLYMFENTYSITGAKADHRFPTKLSSMDIIITMIMVELVSQLKIPVLSVGSKDLNDYLTIYLNRTATITVPGFTAEEAKAIVDDLLQNKGNSILIGSSRLSKMGQSLIFLMNQYLNNETRTVMYRHIPFSAHPLQNESNLRSIQHLTQSLKKRNIETLIILGGNPVYNTPYDVKFKKYISYAKTVIHLSSLKNETTDFIRTVIRTIPCPNTTVIYHDI